MPSPGEPGQIVSLATTILPDNRCLVKAEHHFCRWRSYVWRPVLTARVQTTRGTMHAQIPLDLSRRRDMRTTPPRPYRLPPTVRERLVTSLEPFRNRERALGLAVFLGRFWSMPGRVALPFPIDRRALADHQALGLTEGEVRGAIRTLEAVGFLARWEITGSRYKPTPDGLHRKPIPFVFGADYAPLFIAANGRAAAARGADPQARSPHAPGRPARPSVSVLPARSKPSRSEGLKLFHNLPKSKSEADLTLLMGENLNLPHLSEAALKAIGIAGAKRGGCG